MGVFVEAHGAYRDFAGGTRSFVVTAPTVGAALDALVVQRPALAERLRDEHGRLRPHLNIYLNRADIRSLAGEATAVQDGDVIHLLPAVSGG